MEITVEQRKLPWEGRPSIYEYVKTHQNKIGTIFYPDWNLPDTRAEQDPYILEVYTPGADDWLEQGKSDDVDPKFVERLADIIERYSETGKEEDKLLLYNIAKEDHVIAYWGDVSYEITKRGVFIEPFILKLGQWMAREAPDRGVVKFGISLVGVSSSSIEDLSMLRVLGMHDEFTYFVGEALRNMTPMWDIILMEMAKKLFSWGRYQAISLLALESDNKEVRSWMVREGFRYFYIPSYMTLICMEYGGLPEEMASEEWYKDKRLLGAVQVMIIDLLNESTQFEHSFGGEIIQRYLASTLGKRRTPIHYCVLTDLQNFLEKAMNDTNICDLIGMTEEECSNTWIDVKRELQKSWCEKLRAKLGSTDIPQYYDYKYLHDYVYDQICDR